MNKTTVLMTAVALATSALFAENDKNADKKLKMPSAGSVTANVLATPLTIGKEPAGKESANGSCLKIGAAKESSATANASISYIGSSDSSSSSGKEDGRVRRALNSAGVNFSVDSDGDFKVNWTLTGGRTHNTFINSRVSNYSGMELREIWAVGFVANSIDSGNLQALLELNATYKLGAWEVQKKSNGQYWAVFSVKVAADASGEVLKLMSNLVAQAADGIEAKATHKDEL